MENQTKQNRIKSIDVIRGLAILGLIPMNIIIFSMPMAAYLNPDAFFGDQLTSYISYFFTSIIFDQKMMGLFSFLFGCSIVFLNLNKPNKKQGLSHYLRMFVLLGFGVFHHLLFWEGDILLFYAISAFIIYPFIYLKPKLLLSLSCIIWLLIITILLMTSIELSKYIALNNSYSISWNPNPQAIDMDITVNSMSFIDSIWHRLDGDLIINELDSLILIPAGITSILRIFAMMFLGMAFTKAGLWNKIISKSTFNKAIFALIIGWSIGAIAFLINSMNDWNIQTGIGISYILLQFSTVISVLAYIYILIYLVQNNFLVKAFDTLKQVGRMPLTLYLMQSALMAYIFRGWGLDLFASLNRLEIWGVILVLWFIQIVFAIYWLKHFEQGPLEYIWRKLTWKSKQFKLD